MIVECPRCRARYRVDDDVVEEDPTFKCSRCSHIFAYEGAGSVEASSSVPEESLPEPEIRLDIPPVAPAAEPVEPAIARPPDRADPPKASAAPESLSFDFARRQAASRRPMEVADESSFDEDDGAHSLKDDDDEFSFAEDEDPPVDREETEAAQRPDEPRFVREIEALRFQQETGRTPTRPTLVFLGVLIAAYGILSLDLVNHPEAALKLFASVPVIGDVITEDHLLQTKIHLEDVEGIFQQIKDDRVVFIVSGRAVNTSSEPLKGVQIESGLYDDSGRTVDTKSIYCGNAMSLKIVRDLSSKEISLLQRLEPPKRFEIRPGESAGFSVVFMTPPSGLKEFSAKVLAAQPVAS